MPRAKWAISCVALSLSLYPSSLQACFTGGLLAMAAKNGPEDKGDWYLSV
jgi:hypothetical protein